MILNARICIKLTYIMIIRGIFRVFLFYFAFYFNLSFFFIILLLLAATAAVATANRNVETIVVFVVVMVWYEGIFLIGIEKEDIGTYMLYQVIILDSMNKKTILEMNQYADAVVAYIVPP
jgi:hypothetical protein